MCGFLKIFSPFFFRSRSCMFYFYCARIHFKIGGWLLWQWRHCHFLYVIHLLLMDKICQNWTNLLGCLMFSCLLLHGVFMGRICVSHQFDSNACLHTYNLWKIYSQNLYSVFNCLLSWHFIEYADFICGISTSSNFRTHVGKLSF